MGSAWGQTPHARDHDSTQYQSYREQLTARIYLSRKYTVIKFTPPEKSLSPILKYRANTSLNVGIGASYRSLTLNIGIGVSSFNPNSEKGETKYLDMQGHFYTRKWNYDFMGQVYHGFYLTPEGLAAPEGENYYVRNDMHLELFGIAAFRALNDRKFSYQAGLVQNEWQKKSAGSFLIGGEAFYGSIHADSSLVPSELDPGYAEKDISKVHFLEIGPGIGYAYSLIIKKHFFILASAAICLDLRYSQEIYQANMPGRLDFTPNFSARAGIGYNSQKWSLSILWFSTRIHVLGAESDYRYSLSPGNYRLIYARRFTLAHEVKKVINPVNDLIEPN
jgi:hypothetical protein